jgi:iron complex outermembrane receptor protein/vitamin B12 transporter
MDVATAVDLQSEEARNESEIVFGSRKVPARYSFVRKTVGLAAEARLDWGRLLPQFGIRYDMVSGEDSIWSPAASLRYRSERGCDALGAGVSAASKLPSFYALANPLVGNKELLPERATQYEAYCERTSGAWRGRLAVFSAVYRNLVDFDAGPPPRLVNRSRIDSRGIELSVQHDITASVRAQLNGMLMNVRGASGEPPLRQRPRQQANLLLDTDAPMQLNIGANIRFIGRRFDSSIPTGDTWLRTALTLDFIVKHSSRSFDVFVGVDNLLDRRFDSTIGTNGSQRRVRAGLTWRLS